jgi:RND family efflux transporter MFP subunit
VLFLNNLQTTVKALHHDIRHPNRNQLNMGKKKIFYFIGIVIIVSVATTFAYYLNGRGDHGGDRVLRYKDIPVQRATFQVMVSANGIVRPIDRIEIKSKASGEIVEIPVEEGLFVKKGELIARLDQKDESAAVKQAQADLDIARAELNQAQRVFDRRRKLFDADLISEEELGGIELNLAVAKGGLVRATTTLDRAKERFSESVVRAPVDGVILQKYVEKGQIIASGVSNVSGGSPIVDIAAMGSVYIEAGIDEIDIGKIEPGQPAIIVAEASPDLKYHGKIVRIAPESRIDQNVTLFDIIIEVENIDRKLKSGMNTTIEVMIINKPDVLMVPAVAVQGASEVGKKPVAPGVLLKTGDGYEFREITIGLSDFKDVEILSGLEEGDVVGVAMTSRLQEANDRLEDRIRSSRGFGNTKGR